MISIGQSLTITSKNSSAFCSRSPTATEVMGEGADEGDVCLVGDTVMDGVIVDDWDV